jgi:hypothetical protein
MKRTMTRKKIMPRLREIKELVAGEEDFLRPLVGLVVQEVPTNCSSGEEESQR